MRPAHVYANPTDEQYHQRTATRALMILLSAAGWTAAEIATLLFSKPSLDTLFPNIGYSHLASGREKQSMSIQTGRYTVGWGINNKGQLNFNDWEIKVGTSPRGGWFGPREMNVSFTRSIWEYFP